jgi:flagellar basal-body rod protein FlgB
MEIVGLLERALNIRAVYQRVLASNIANVETPGYKEKDIDFKAALARSMKGTEDIEIKEKDSVEGVVGLDGNTVNMENQIVKLTENTLMFNALVQSISKRFSRMLYAINEGRR